MTRFSKKYLIIGILGSFLIGAFLGFIMQVGGKFSLSYYLIGFFAISIFLSLYQVAFYFTSGYEIGDDGITCVKGVLFKKRSYLEYEKIKSLNKKQSFFGQVFRYGILQVFSSDNASSNKAEFTIIEDSDNIDVLIDIIKEKQSEKKNEGKKKKNRKKEKAPEVINKEEIDLKK